MGLWNLNALYFGYVFQLVKVQAICLLEINIFCISACRQPPWKTVYKFPVQFELQVSM